MPVRGVIKTHSAVDFVPAMAEYLAKHVPDCVIEHSETDRIDVLKRISTELPSLERLTEDTTCDIICATSEFHIRGRKRPEPPHFDTIFVHVDDRADIIGLEGSQTVCIRVIFRVLAWFQCSDTLAYIESFSSFGPGNASENVADLVFNENKWSSSGNNHKYCVHSM
ncbi:hypothetical protein M422DRAFT_270722 [Sphaerobolus stellatus SS14]|uniref:Uncharacterized protein n=1 Tax=Sphaerobolus stellatus (strain SS14) TaxID=990650 RepID=A0A0C9U1U0_SPHS4|nr:hypothetical protein M422DRAFT_270722 [Sphaerobolus stellatus SS14]